MSELEAAPRVSSAVPERRPRPVTYEFLEEGANARQRESPVLVENSFNFLEEAGGRDNIKCNI